MAKGHEQLTGFIPTIKKPDYMEALAIVAAQMKNPNRLIVTYHTGEKGPYERTRIPSCHVKHSMKRDVLRLIGDMQSADYVQIVDLSER